MKKNLSTITTLVKERKNISRLTTYNSGLLQAKAYRLLKTYISTKLKEYGISTVEWALLGQLYESASLSVTDIARVLDVEKPFATNLTEELRIKGLVKRIVDKEDRRSKRVSLTDKGRTNVPIIEKEVRAAMGAILKNVTAEDVFAYVRVLEEIVKNTSVRKF